MSSGKRPKKSKRENKNLQQLKRLEVSRVDVVPECVLFGILVEYRVSFFSVDYQQLSSSFFRPEPIFLHLSTIDQVITTSLGKFGSKPRCNSFSMLGALVSSLKEHTKKKSDIWSVPQKFALMLNLFHGNRSAAWASTSQQHSKMIFLKGLGRDRLRITSQEISWCALILALHHFRETE